MKIGFKIYMDIKDQAKLKEEISKKKKEGWIEAWFAVEALAVKENVVENALKDHVERLSRAKDVFAYDTQFLEVKKVENPTQHIKEGFSQVAEMKLFIRNLNSLVAIIIVYGPSSIEIIGPEKKDLKIEEMQNMANLLAGYVHQFAAAGVGGLVISSGKGQ